MTRRATRQKQWKRFGEYLDTNFPLKTAQEPGGQDKYSQTQAILSRFVQDDEQSQIHSDVFDTFMGAKPLRATLPDDMPPLEKTKLYARSGYHLHHLGTDEDFERVWEEAFPEEEEGRKV